MSRLAARRELSSPPLSPSHWRLLLPRSSRVRRGQTEKLQSEVLISTLPAADLTKQIAAATGTIEHKSEVARGGPVAAVVRPRAA